MSNVPASVASSASKRATVPLRVLAAIRCPRIHMTKPVVIRTTGIHTTHIDESPGLENGPERVGPMQRCRGAKAEN